MDSEEALKAQAEVEKKEIVKDWQTKLNTTVKQAREQEMAKA